MVEHISVGIANIRVLQVFLHCKIVSTLRLPGTHAAKINEKQTPPPCTFHSIVLLLDHLSKL